MREIILRLRMEGPLFFKRLQGVLAALLAVSVFLKSQDADFYIFGISVIDMCVGANAVGIFFARLPVKNVKELERKLESATAKPQLQ